MEVMSICGSRPGSKSRDLLSAYDLSLERQILVGGCGLPCEDEDVWKQAEELLEDGDARDAHCLGLEPLAVMEESLKGVETAAGGGRRHVQPRGGLQGLAKAFEVLELAALNLYLGPWREEYKVVKMYSGMFTHLIKPVFSVQQTHHLFSLLGYQPCSAPPQQLRLQPASTSSDHFLRRSCAFFLARCECRLLLAALGSHGGDAQWELSLVRERRRGHSVQVALDNTKKTLTVSFDGEGDMDLYTDDQVNGGHEEADVPDDQQPRSLTWTPESHAPAVKTNGNETPSSPSASREHIYRSTLRASPLNSISGATFSRRPQGEAASDRVDAESSGAYASGGSWFVEGGAEADHACSCLQSQCVMLNHCVDCDTFHDITCALYKQCCNSGHRVTFIDKTMDERTKMTELSTIGGAAFSSLCLHDDDVSIPMAYHNCCDPAHPDPDRLCFSCLVFHSESCADAQLCQSRRHSVRTLGTCSFGTRCRGKPHVLCRYCGNEYCKDCWFRNPITCTCGQTFDQSSSV